MRLKQLRLRDFRLFHKLDLDFRPLTVLTGPNSSGKSVVLSALAALMQTNHAGRFPLGFAPAGPICSLGQFRDILKRGSHSKRFYVGITAAGEKSDVKLRYDAVFRHSPVGEHILPHSIQAEGPLGTKLSIEWLGDTEGYRLTTEGPDLSAALDVPEPAAQLLSGLIEFAVRQKERPAATEGESRATVVTLTLREKEKPAATGVEGPTVHGQKDVAQLREPRQALIPEGSVWQIEKEILGDPIGAMVYSLIKAQGAELASCEYVGPLRAQPARFYLREVPSAPQDPMGKDAAVVLLDWKSRDKDKYRLVQEALRQLELAEVAYPRESAEELLSLRVRPFEHKERVGLADVGFGVSQVLPVLVADVRLPDGGTLLVNQPEVHLHPSSQALLGDYFVNRLGPRSYVIETHSEYLLTRLRLLVAKGRLDPAKVAVYFFDGGRNPEGVPAVHQIEFGKDGAYIGAPNEFFKTYYQDAFDIAMHGFESRDGHD